MLQSTCNVIGRKISRKNASCNTSLLCSVVSNPHKLQDKLQIGHITRYNLPATPLQDKFQEKMHHVTSAYPVQMFQAPKKLQDKLQIGPITCCNLPSTSLRDKFQEKINASCNISLLCPIVSSPKKLQGKL